MSFNPVTGLMTMLIGPRGGGKTTAATWVAQDAHERFPHIPVVSNVPIENTIYESDIIRFLKTKLIVEGGEKNYELDDRGLVHIIPARSNPFPMIVICDEGAISGFEARGSGLYVGASYILALSRKLNIDLWLVSQLMSMIDKRGQWLADRYWLCESFLREGGKRIDRFRYKVYDEEFHFIGKWNLSGAFAEAKLFGRYNTFDFPNYDYLARAYRAGGIETADENKYKELVNTFNPSLYDGIKVAQGIQQSVEPDFYFFEKKALSPPRERYPGDTIIVEGERYQILQRDWHMDKKQYQYRARRLIGEMVA